VIQYIFHSMKTNKERRKIDGNWVKTLRNELGLSQEAFAERLGVSRPSVARWELDLFRPTKLASNLLLQLAATTRDKSK
jgi:DNA-binding transcriptional regulator YiaG